VRLLVPPLVGSAAMMGIMMLAPANAWRQAVMPPPDNLLLVIPYSLRYAFDFIRFTIRGQLTPFVVYAAAAALLTLAAFSAARLRLSLRQLLTGAAVALGVMYALIVCSFAPSAYAGLAYPAGRALMPGSFILLAGLGAAAGFLALALRRVLPAGLKEWLPLAALIALILVSLYPFRALSVVRRDIDQLSPRAERWDARNIEILAQMARGESQILVKQTDVVQNLEDIGPDPTQWVNICAADFYGVQSITANP
jgi:hypothetical protein